MFQTTPPFAERIAANKTFLAQYPHASDKEDEVTHATPVAAKKIDLSIPFVPFADQQASPVFGDYGNLRVGTPAVDALRGH